MPITIGDAILYLRAKDTNLDKDLAGAETKTKTVLGRIAGTFKESMNFAMGQIMAQGLNQLASGIENMATEVVQLGMEYSKQVEDIARMSGSSVEDASRIIQVADDMKMSYGDLSTALKMYAKTQADNGVATQLSIETLANLSDQYLALAPGMDRTNFLLQNFGRNGLEMGKMMEQGGKGIRDMAGSVESSLVMTQQGIDAANDYYKALDSWEDGVKGVKNQLAQVLMPYMEEFMKWLVDVGIPNLTKFLDAFKALPEPVKITIIAIGGLIVLLAQLGPVFMGLAALVSLLGGAGAGGGLFAGLAAAIGAVSLPVAALAIAIGALIAVIVINWDTLANLATMGPRLWIACFNRIIYEVKKFVNDFITAIRSLSKLTTAEWIALGKAIPTAILNGIKAAWKTLIDGVKALINDLLKQFNLQLEIKSPSKVFERVGVMSAAGYGQGFAGQMADQVRGQVLGSLGALTQSADSRTMIGPVEFHGNLTTIEKRLLYGSVEEHTSRTLLKAMKNMRR